MTGTVTCHIGLLYILVQLNITNINNFRVNVTVSLKDSLRRNDLQKSSISFKNKRFCRKSTTYKASEDVGVERVYSNKEHSFHKDNITV